MIWRTSRMIDQDCQHREFKCDKGMVSEVFDAHDDAPAPSLLTAHMVWIPGSTSCPFEGQIRNCVSHTPDLSPTLPRIAHTSSHNQDPPNREYEFTAALTRRAVQIPIWWLDQGRYFGTLYDGSTGQRRLTMTGRRTLSRYQIPASVHGTAQSKLQGKLHGPTAPANATIAAVPCRRPPHHRALLPRYHERRRDQGSLHCWLLRGISLPALHQPSLK
jgi:hypothetical protein